MKEKNYKTSLIQLFNMQSKYSQTETDNLGWNLKNKMLTLYYA